MDRPPLFLNTLGELRPDVAVAVGSPRKALALLTYLARRTPQRARREELMALFWGERPEARARQSLRQVLLELRQVLGDSLRTESEVVVLADGAVRLDATEFERDVSAGRLDAAVGRWHGDFLAGAEDLGGESYRVWLESEREALRQRYAFALERLVAGCVERAAWSDAARWAEQWATAFPHDERAHAHVLRALAACNRREEALARHGAFVVRLRHDLELEPSPELLETARHLNEANLPVPPPAQWLPVTESEAMTGCTEAWNDVQAGGFAAVWLRGGTAEAHAHAIDRFLARGPVGTGGRLLLEARAEASGAWSTARRLLAPLRRARGLSGVADPVLATLSSLVPEIRERFPRLPGADDSPTARRAAVAQVLADVAAEARIVVRVDQVGDADAESGALLRHILEECPAGVLLLLSDAAGRFEDHRLDPASHHGKHCFELRSSSAAIRLEAPAAKPRVRLLSGSGRRIRVASLWLLPLAVATAFAALRGPHDASGPGTDRLAVLPFTLHGDPRNDYLREGLAELLSTSLDGSTAWRTVEVSSVMRLVGTERSSIDEERGRGVAARTGANLYVLGSITESGRTLRVQASLYRRSDRRLLARASAEGTADSLFLLVDELASQLLGHVADGQGGHFASIAALTTDSLNALKSYLDGAAALRGLNVREAYDGFRRAVAIDSSFALAWYGQATAASWLLAPELALASAEHALRHAGRLNPRDRTLVEAFHAFLGGRADEAEQLVRIVIAHYPDDVERRMQLAEILFHHAWRRGGSMRDAAPELQRVLRADPGHVPAMLHLAQIALLDGQRARADSLLTRLVVAYGEAPTAQWLGSLQAALRGNRQMLQTRLVGLYDAGDWWLTLALWDLARFTPDLTPADRAALLLTDAGRSKAARAVGHLARAHIELARGRLRNARAELGQLETQHPSWSTEYGALLTAAWFLPSDTNRYRHFSEQLERWDPATMPPVAHRTELQPWTTVHDGVHAEIRRYLIGLLRLRRGDAAAALAEAELLGAYAGTDARAALARGLGSGLRAQVLRLQGRPRDALALLEQSRIEAPHEYSQASAFFSQALERFMQAELLAELGRYDDALAILRTFSETSLLDAIYRAPAELKAGEIAERRAQPERALTHYSRFIELWQDCDPELRPVVVAAQRRIERIRSQLR